MKGDYLDRLDIIISNHSEPSYIEGLRKAKKLYEQLGLKELDWLSFPNNSPEMGVCVLLWNKAKKEAEVGKLTTEGFLINGLTYTHWQTFYALFSHWAYIKGPFQGGLDNGMECKQSEISSNKRK